MTPAPTEAELEVLRGQVDVHGTLAADGLDTAYGAVVLPHDGWGTSPRVALAGGLEQVLRLALGAWSADGSVVLVRGDREDLAARFASEGVTVDARENA